MKMKFIILYLFFSYSFIWAQTGFIIDENKKKVVIPFELINNLIFIPMNVNGVELTFLLDTGSDETILFSLEDKDNLSFNNLEKVKLKGFGNNNDIEGLKSSNNILSTNGFSDQMHVLYIVLDQDFNFSSQVGISVNGIIGSNFFKNNLVEINYQKGKIYIYKEDPKIRKKLANNFVANDIEIEKGKPYIISKLTILDNEIETKMLVDTGNSDALWIFQNEERKINIPVNNFDDYLGHGFSGEVYGKRARVSKFTLNKFQFNNPLASFPDSLAIKNNFFIQDRSGSIGSEIIKRFNVVFDYPKEKIYFKKNDFFDSPFNFNMSGIEIQHDGLQLVKENINLNNSKKTKDPNDIISQNAVNVIYNFALKPIYKITSVRKNSPAEQCGLKKGDIIIKINKNEVYKYSLQEINELLKSDEDKWIYMQVERNKEIMNFKFQLKSIL